MKNKIVARICISLTITLLFACGGTSNTYTLGGTVSNLTSSGLVLSNGTETIGVPANATNISFPTPLFAGATYGITIVSQPVGFTDVCALGNGSGTVGSANVTNIVVLCHPAVVTVSTLAGNGNFGSANGSGSVASFNYPTGIAVDALGMVYVADSNNNMIRKITPNGEVTTLAGSGIKGSTNGVGTDASFYLPTGVAVDTLGNVYVADAGNNMIRKINPSGEVTTLAGSGINGSTNGAGTAATFAYPVGVAVDALGNVYVADSSNNLIRKIDTTGVVTTLAGSGSQGSANGIGIAASFAGPNNLAVDALGNVYVTEVVNRLVRKINAVGEVTTLAGNGSQSSKNGIGIAASFSQPEGIAIDSLGNAYVADYGTNLIRKINTAGLVTTLAGSGSFGNVNGVGTAATFSFPFGVAIDNMGNIYVADSSNQLIRKISPQ